jgi:hypothetical protein
MRHLLVCAAFVILCSSIHATVLVPIEFRELVTASPVIVHGQVIDVRTQWVDDRRSIETLITVEATDYLRGNLGAHVTVKMPGGQMGRYRTTFVGAPQFRSGDEVVLFLKSSGTPYPTVVGFSQGVFRVVPDSRTGRRMIAAPILMAKLGGEPEVVVRGDVARKPQSIESFRDIVLQVLSTAGVVR